MEREDELCDAILKGASVVSTLCLRGVEPARWRYRRMSGNQFQLFLGDCNPPGGTLFHAPAVVGNVAMVAPLVAMGVDINASNQLGITPLSHGAVTLNNIAYCRELLRCGADPNESPIQRTSLLDEVLARIHRDTIAWVGARHKTRFLARRARLCVALLLYDSGVRYNTATKDNRWFGRLVKNRTAATQATVLLLGLQRFRSGARNPLLMSENRDAMGCVARIVHDSWMNHNWVE